MRAYFFGNMYLSSIQQGIQALHVTSEMSIKYSPGLPEASDYEEWAYTHKTVILLSGGMASDLRNLTRMFDVPANTFCWSYFCEEQNALEGSITSVGIILPERIYAGATAMREYQISAADLGLINGTMVVLLDGVQATQSYTRFEAMLMETMNSCRLAS